jgi:signal transduction histidine kinase
MLLVRNFSISKKLTWMNLLASGIALAVACAAFIVYDVMSFRALIVRNLSIQAQIVGANSISSLLFNDPQSAEDTLAALKSAPNILQAVIYTKDGQIFAAYHHDAKDRSEATKPELLAYADQKRWLRGTVDVRRPIVFEGNVRGTVYIQSSLQDLFDRLKRYLTIVGSVFLVSLMAGILLSFFIRRSLAEPILQLAETAQTVSREKNYSIRVPLASAGRDELSNLVYTFNDMLEQIETRDRELQEAHNHLEQRVAERTTQLNAANEELEAFSYSVSHDLRAPLRHMSAFSQLLEEECSSGLNEEAKHYIERIQESAKRMGQLVDDLLKMAQVSRRSLNSASTDLNVLLKDVLAELQPEFEKRTIRWNIGELPWVNCDAGLMKQVFANLLSNAVKYSRRRETAIIEVGEKEIEGQRTIFVRDNGAGFDQRYADKLFGVFQRLHRAEDFEGTGVGLATVQRIIKRHGGRIWAASEVEKGSTFFFTLLSLENSGSPILQAAAAK